MSAYENIEIAYVGIPTTTEVIERIRRYEPCHADPASGKCGFTMAKDEYLIGDKPEIEVCARCAVFDAKRKKLIEDWTEWILALEDVYT